MIFSMLFAVCFLASACETPTMQYALQTENIRVKNRYDAPFGKIHLRMSESEEPFEVSLSRRKGGYMIHTPAYVTEKTTAHWVISKDKEYRWFIGIRGRMEF
jgi:hypothetical protein